MGWAGRRRQVALAKALLIRVVGWSEGRRKVSRSKTEPKWRSVAAWREMAVCG